MDINHFNNSFNLLISCVVNFSIFVSLLLFIFLILSFISLIIFSTCSISSLSIKPSSKAFWWKMYNLLIVDLISSDNFWYNFFFCENIDNDKVCINIVSVTPDKATKDVTH